jgi:hypothetical protein
MKHTTEWTARCWNVIRLTNFEDAIKELHKRQLRNLWASAGTISVAKWRRSGKLKKWCRWRKARRNQHFVYRLLLTGISFGLLISLQNYWTTRLHGIISQKIVLPNVISDKQIISRTFSMQIIWLRFTKQYTPSLMKKKYSFFFQRLKSFNFQTMLCELK